MSEIITGNYYYLNNALREADSFVTEYHINPPEVYEVIRVIDGIPLFLEEHYERLIHTASTIHRTIHISREELERRIITLVKECDLPNVNVKLIINNYADEENGCGYLFCIPTHYPSEEQYAQGVDTDLFEAERQNPQAKIINQSLRDASNAYIKEHDLYEVILVSSDGSITEGSRSNIFFVKEDALYTSPAHGVLPGITRQHLVRLCKEHDILLKETQILADELDQFDGAFISGTSPKVLPIRSIGDHTMDIHQPVLQKIKELYDKEISTYLFRHSI